MEGVQQKRKRKLRAHQRPSHSAAYACLHATLPRSCRHPAVKVGLLLGSVVLGLGHVGGLLIRRICLRPDPLAVKACNLPGTGHSQLINGNLKGS